MNTQQRSIEIIPMIKYTSSMDSFKTSIEGIFGAKALFGHLFNVFSHFSVCELAAEGIGAIFGPSSPYTSSIVGSIAGVLEIPHIVTHWQPYLLNEKYHSMTVNMYPDSEVLAAALCDLVDDYDWTTFTIIYDDDDSLIRLKDVIGKHEPDDHPITVRQIDDNSDQRPLLKAIQDMGENRIIIDIRPDRIIDFLKQAEEVNLFGDYVSFIIVDLDTHTLDFEEIAASKTNITAMRLINSHSDEHEYMIQLWKQRDKDLKIEGTKNYVRENFSNKNFFSAFIFRPFPRFLMTP